MRTNVRFLALGLVAAGALLVPGDARATCGNSIGFGQTAGYLTTPSNNPGNIRSNFWTLNAGSPAVGTGADNGAQADSTAPWIKPFGTSLYVTGDWGSIAGLDGCIEATPVANERMVFTFSDVSGTVPVFAVSCMARNTSAGVQFDIDTTTGGDLVLSPAPKAAIVNTVRVGSEASITVGAPNFAANFHTDNSVTCDLATVIPSYDVYAQQIARGGATPTNSDATAWTLVGNGIASGTNFTFSTTCGATNCDVFVAVAPHFNSGFTLAEAATGQVARVGADSNRMQAGPTLAETPKFKVIPNKPDRGPKSKQQQ